MYLFDNHRYIIYAIAENEAQAKEIALSKVKDNYVMGKVKEALANNKPDVIDHPHSYIIAESPVLI